MDDLVADDSTGPRSVRQTVPLRAVSPDLVEDGAVPALEEGVSATAEMLVRLRTNAPVEADDGAGASDAAIRTPDASSEWSSDWSSANQAMAESLERRDQARQGATSLWRPDKWTQSREHPHAGGRVARPVRKPGTTIARVVFVTILGLNLLGIVSLRALDSIVAARRATADLSTHLSRIEALLGSDKVPSLEQLGALQNEMAAANADLQSLDQMLPFGGQLPVAQETAAHHALQLGIDALDAGQSAITLALQLAPSLQALVSTVVHGPSSPLPPGSHFFTRADQAAAQGTVYNFLIPSWQAALADRQRLSAGDLDSLDNSQLTTFVARFDELAPNVSLMIEVAHQLVDASPRLVGIEKPEHFLLLNMDTDELRATGGFLGNYADLEIVNGALVSGVHLHDVYTLDCPNSQCPNNPVPAQDSWFTIAGGKFAMRDSNLDPDFPASALTIEQLYQHEGGGQVDGVIAITPAVIASILGVTGPVNVPPFGVSVTADNLRDLLHYYHQNFQIAQHLGINAPALGTSIGKVFDVLAAQAVLARLRSLTPSQQAALGRALLQDLATKDIQLYSNVEHVQDVIVRAGVGGHVATAPFDSLAVVDTNDGATYSNSDMRESVMDQVRLDGTQSEGQVGVAGASHALSITYNFPVVAHPYTQDNVYDDFVRVIVPNNATKLVVGGPCTAFAATEAFHKVLACKFSLRRGSSTTLTFSWYVPNPTTAQGALLPYSLFVERQPGATVQMQVAVAPPAGGAFAPTASPGTIQKGVLIWSTSPLTSDTTLHAPLQGEGGSA